MNLNLFKHITYDLYLIELLQFDLFLKKKTIKNFLYYICFEFKYFLLTMTYPNQIYSKIYYIMRTFTQHLNYRIKKIKFITKKKI